MSGNLKFQNFEEHKVKTNHTLANIAQANGITWQQLAEFNWATSAPKDINECLHDLVGCRHRTKNHKNYIFTNHDQPGIIYVPIESPAYNLPAGRRHTISILQPHLRTDIEVETVDDFRQPLGNVSLVLERQEGGADVEITTDGSGYGKAERILTGHYKVTVKGGGPAFFLFKTFQPDNDDADADVGEFEEAVIDTRHRVEAITQVVAERRATKADKQHRRLLQREYTRKKNVAAKGRGDETSEASGKVYNRLQPTVALDNLALLAGWKDDGTIDISNLVSTVLGDFVKDYGSTQQKRGYYVWVIERAAKPPQITLYSSSGKRDLSFKLARGLIGYYGAYGTYERTAGQLLVDLISKTTSFAAVDQGDKVIPLDDFVDESDRGRFNDAPILHRDRDEAPIVYILPSPAQLAYIGIHGGSGRLEDYGYNEEANERIHKRNQQTCAIIGNLYNAYIVRDYVKKVKATKNEKELRKLGPPWAPYVMPPPGNVTPSRLIDIYSAYSVDTLAPWRAIAAQLDKFANRMSEGLPFLSLKAKYEIGVEDNLKKNVAFLGGLATSTNEPIPTAVEIEGSLTFQFSEDEVRALLGKEIKSKASIEGEFKHGKYKLGLEFKRALDKPEEWEVTIKTGPLELEAGKDSKGKVALEVFPEIWAESEANPRKATFEGGLKIETKAILRLVEKLPLENTAVGEFFKKHGERVIPAEISVHAGFVGLTQRTALAAVANIPGFFEVRDPDELVALQWNTLAMDERIHLAALGWDQCSWDLKSYADAELPKSMEEEWEEFSPSQQIAVLYLGFYDADDYHKRVGQFRGKNMGWEQALKQFQCARDEREAGQARSGE